MLNTKKTTRKSNHGSESTYFDSVTAVTSKTIAVFIPALDVEVDVQRNPDASIQNGSAPEVGDIATMQAALEDGDYAVTAATFVHQQETGGNHITTDDNLLLLDDDDEEAEEYDWYNEPPAEDFGNRDID